MATSTQLAGARMVPHLIRVQGWWHCLWRDRETGLLFTPAQVHFMTRNSHRGSEARRWCGQQNGLTFVRGWA